jgi:hypothetical protein
MFKVLIITIVLIAIAGILMATSILFNKLLFNIKGRFPNTSIGHNPNLQKLGITCAKGDARKEFNKSKQQLGCSTEGGASCGCG